MSLIMILPTQCDRMVGVAPAATLIPLRAIKSVVVILNGDVAKAVHYAAEIGCHVISMSLGGTGIFGLEAAVNYAVERNIIVLAAAGNEVGFVVAPASYEHCIAIAACNNDRKPWRGSSHGKKVAVTAPGENVYVAQPRDAATAGTEIGPGSGTSFAVAAVAGLAALWLAHYGRDALLNKYRGQATLQEVFRKVVSNTAVPPVNWELDEYGAGIVDAKALLLATLPSFTVNAAVRAASISTFQVQTSTERLLRFFDDLPRQDVLRQLNRMLQQDGKSRRGLDPSQMLEQYAAELLHIFMQNPTAARSLRRGIQAGAAVRASALHPVIATDVARDVADFASTTLARTLAP